MRLIVSAPSLQRLARRWKASGTKVGFVPTMGYLHAGHVSLIKRARRLVGRKGIVVVSIYVNPTQFAAHEDLSQYPRDLDRDRDLCAQAGADILFVPSDGDMYPGAAGAGSSTFVVEEAVSQGMEGASRPTHFRGVTTVVAKLFNLVLPDIAVFGAKDYQQGAVIQRMVRDLWFPVRLVIAPTVREADGLAMSSRNKYLSPDERPQATILWRALGEARERVRARRQGVDGPRLKAALARLIATQPAARLDYLEFFDPLTLRPESVVRRGTHLALAVFIGNTRLIDNGPLT